MTTDRSRKITEFTAATIAAPTDAFLIAANTAGAPVNRKLPVGTLFGNIISPTTFANNVSVSVDKLTIRNNITPANSTALSTVTAGTIWADDTYLYVAVADGIVKRVGLTLF